MRKKLKISNKYPLSIYIYRQEDSYIKFLKYI